jgi:hypothetical protein
MIILAILILVVAVVFGLDVVWKDAFHIGNVTAFGQNLGIHNANSLFVLGAIVGAAILLGIFLLMAGVRARARGAVANRRQRRSFRETTAERERLHEENSHLRAQLEQVANERDLEAERHAVAEREAEAARARSAETEVAPRGAGSERYIDADGAAAVGRRDTMAAPAYVSPTAAGTRGDTLGSAGYVSPTAAGSRGDTMNPAGYGSPAVADTAGGGVAPGSIYEDGQPVVELRNTEPAAPVAEEPVATERRSGWLHRSRS